MMTHHWWTRTTILILALALAVAGCDSDDGDGDPDTVDMTADSSDVSGDQPDPDADDDADGGEDVSDDTEIPEYRDFRVTLGSPVDATIDLNNGDEEVTVPISVDATFTVFARDNESATDALSVVVVDGEGTPVSMPGDAVFANGLWEVSVTADPGTALSVTVTDEAGNEAPAPSTLTLTALADAVVGDWVQRYYNLEQNVTHVWESTWSTDGTWTEVRNPSPMSMNPTVTYGGTFSVDGNTMTVEERTKSGGSDEDADEMTVERAWEFPFFIDETYFSDMAFQRTSDEEEGLAGTWERSYSMSLDNMGTLELAEEGTIVLELTTGGDFTETTTITTYEGGMPADTVTTRTGTWDIELSENYVESAGNFLLRNVTEVNEEAVDETEFQLHVVRGDFLLISPRLPAE